VPPTLDTLSPPPAAQVPVLPAPVVWPPKSSGTAPTYLDVRAMVGAYPNPARLREVANLLDTIYAQPPINGDQDPEIQNWLRLMAVEIEAILADPQVKLALEDQERREQQ
jgi:hypothetical protein